MSSVDEGSRDEGERGNAVEGGHEIVELSPLVDGEDCDGVTDKDPPVEGDTDGEQVGEEVHAERVDHPEATELTLNDSGNKEDDGDVAKAEKTVQLDAVVDIGGTGALGEKDREDHD